MLSWYGYGVGATRVALKGGEYDVFRRDSLKAELDAIPARGDVELDLRATTFMDAGAIGLLIGFRRRLLDEAPDARMRLLNAPPIVRRVLILAGGESLFEITP